MIMITHRVLASSVPQIRGVFTRECDHKKNEALQTKFTSRAEGVEGAEGEDFSAVWASSARDRSVGCVALFFLAAGTAPCHSSSSIALRPWWGGSRLMPC